MVMDNQKACIISLGCLTQQVLSSAIRVRGPSTLCKQRTCTSFSRSLRQSPPLSLLHLCQIYPL